MKLLLLVGAVALAAGTTAGIILRPTSRTLRKIPAAPLATASPLVSKNSMWQPLWTHPTPNIRDLSLSDDGSSVAWVDSNGSVRRIDVTTGETVWQAAPIDGLNRVCAGANGNIFAYSRLNPLQQSVHLFSTGVIKGPQTVVTPRIVSYAVEGAVWAVATTVYRDGSSAAAIGTGRSLLYLLSIPPLKPTLTSPIPSPAAVDSVVPKRIGVQGIPNTIDMVGGDVIGNKAAASVFAGTWQDSGITTWSAAGVPLLRVDDRRPDQEFVVHLSADGTTAVDVSSRRPRGKEVLIKAWDIRTKQPHVEESLNAEDVCALVSPHGDFVAVSYKISDAVEEAESRRIALFDRQGHRCFQDMGGRFFAPQLVALSANAGHAHVTVYDAAAGYFYTLDEDGQILSHLRLRYDNKTGAPPSIDRTLTTHDGRFLLLQLGDGQIELYKANSL